MTERLRDQIAQLKAIMPQLHAATDDAARIVQQVETFLGEECKLGITAFWTFDRHDYGDGSEFVHRLAYGRIEGQFRLLVTEGFIEQWGEDRISSQTAWVNCTREMKLRTVEYIPELLNAIVKKVSATIRQTHEATATVNSLLRDLGIEGKEVQS